MGSNLSDTGQVDTTARFRTFNIAALRQRIATQNWDILNSSGFLAIGVAFARVLGLAFSLVLARAFTPEDYGYVQYMIVLAGVIAIGTQPFGQHVFARLVGRYSADQEKLDEIMNNALWILLGLSLITFVIAIPVSLLLGKLDLGLFVIFIGFTVFYAYYGLARGFLSNIKLLLAYVGSNMAQIIYLVVAVYGFRSRSVLLALLVYGASYFLPLALLQYRAPFPIKLRLTRPKQAIVKDLLVSSIPIWISHVSYIFYQALDVLLLENFRGSGSVGVYSLSKTLSASFTFVPMAVNATLMPRVAGSPKHMHNRLLWRALGLSVGANLILLVGYIALYNWVVGRVFKPSYQVGPEVFVVVALSNIIFGIHSTISAVMVGSNRASAESISLGIALAATIVVGIIAIPAQGAPGAALTTMVGSLVSVSVYVVMALRSSRANANQPAPAAEAVPAIQDQPEQA